MVEAALNVPDEDSIQRLIDNTVEKKVFCLCKEAHKEVLALSDLIFIKHLSKLQENRNIMEEQKTSSTQKLESWFRLGSSWNSLSSNLSSHQRSKNQLRFWWSHVHKL